MSENQAPQQLSLMTTHEVPLQFRIDEATRRRGLQHIAEIRRMLADRQAAKAHTTARTPNPTARTPSPRAPRRAA